jgi:hypothetical protein
VVFPNIGKEIFDFGVEFAGKENFDFGVEGAV